MLPTADAEWVAAELTRTVRPAALVVHADGDRREPLGDPARAARDRSSEGARSSPTATTARSTRRSRSPVPTAKPWRDPETSGRRYPLHLTTRVAEFNDLASVESALAHGDVAAILTEPALTNIGIVLPEPGFMAGLRELATRYGALLMIDETHTISAGPGGATRLWDLQPDIFVIGKSIGGGIPTGAYGISTEVLRMVDAHPEADLVDVGGVGGTLAGNALSIAAMRATLEDVLTDDAFARMIDLATQFTRGVQDTIDRDRSSRGR